jgi:MFS family permease
MNAEQSDVFSRRFSFIFSVLTIVAITITLRSTNNMIVTTIPTFSKLFFHFSNVSVGEITALTYATTFISTSLVNPRLRSVARRRAFVLSVIGMDAALIFLSLSGGYTIWAIAAFSGVAFGIVFPNLITSASIQGDHRAQMRLLAIYSVSLSLSLVIGPSIETYLLPVIGYRLLFIAFLPLSLLATAVAPFVRFPSGGGELGGRGTLKNKSLHSALISISIYNIPFAAITAFLVIYAQQNYGISSGLAYSAFIVFFSSSFLTRLTIAIRPLGNLFPPLVISAVLTALSLILVPFMPSFVLFLVIMVLLGIPHGSIFPVTTMIIARGTDVSERNAANSYFMAYNNILFMIVPVIFGYISSTIGFHIDFIILGVISACFTAVLVVRYWKTGLVHTS